MLTRRSLLRMAAGGAVVGAPLLLRNRPAGYVGGDAADPRAKAADAAVGGWTELKHAPPEVLDLPIVRAVNYHPGSEQLQIGIAKLDALHIQAVRINIGWHEFQPKARHQWDHHFTPWVDEFLPAMGRRNIKVLAGVVFSPPWANGGQAKDSRNFSNDDYCTFLQDVEQRWGDHIEAYEIWNEPGLNGFLQGTVEEKAIRYASLLRAAYPVLKALAPHKPVVGGSLYQPGWDNQEFLTMLYELGAGTSFDILSQHMYGDRPGDHKGFDMAAGPVPYQVMFDAVAARTIDTMSRYGDADKPIWITETGVNTSDGGKGTSESHQAELMAEAYALLTAGYVPTVGRLYWYHLADNAHFDSAEPENRFGITSREGGQWRHKPAFEVLSRVH